MTADLAGFAAAARSQALAVYAVIAQIRAERTAAPKTDDVLGEQLHEGSVVVDGAGDAHRIDHFRDYPAPFLGDHARRAYELPGEVGGWCATIGDHKHFHVQHEGEQP